MQAECGDTDLFDVSSSAATQTVQPLCRDGQANDPARGFPDVLLEQVASGAPVSSPAGVALAQSVQW
jgi:hypothetical protein